jgi:hypothetical protein
MKKKVQKAKFPYAMRHPFCAMQALRSGENDSGMRKENSHPRYGSGNENRYSGTKADQY